MHEAQGRPAGLQSGSRVAVIGGGPAGSFFSYFFLEMAGHAGLAVSVDIYEPKDFSQPGPGGCNMCGGIISESLVQLLAAEGIMLPPAVVQRGIDAYVLHTNAGSVRIEPPGHEKRIAAVYRGGGPRGARDRPWGGFDGYLLGMAQAKGAAVKREVVDAVQWSEGRPSVMTKTGPSAPYDLLVVASGVNGIARRLLQGMGDGFVAPKTARTGICELQLGAEGIAAWFGDAMHVFLLDLPGLEFAALIPKGDYVTLVMLGDEVDQKMVARFLESPEVIACFPPGWRLPQDFCRCFPFINVKGSPRPYADRLIFLGDCGENRLYKDGIGGAYRAAKIAASAAIFDGVSAGDLRKRYDAVCRDLRWDNAVGKLVFGVTGVIRRLRPARRGILRMVAGEQRSAGSPRRMSGVLWDTFTGSASYRDVFLRTLHPAFLLRMLWETCMGLLPASSMAQSTATSSAPGNLGRIYRDGDAVVREGEVGECMYVVQSGKVEVIKNGPGKEICLAELGEGEFFGEMAIFEQEVRSATVRALGDARVLTVDRAMFVRKLHQDPSLAYRMLRKMSGRIRSLDERVFRAVAD